MEESLDTIEYAVQLKLKEFLESQGVDTLLLWNEIEDFVERKVTPCYSKDWSSEIDGLEDEISDLENNVDEAESAFGRLRDNSMDSIKRTSKDLADIYKGLVEMKEILNKLVVDRLASFFRPENNLLELVYFNNARTIFELLYQNRDFVKNLRPTEAEIIDKLCETKSEQDFYKVLFESDIKSPRISVQKIDNLYILM